MQRFDVVLYKPDFSGVDEIPKVEFTIKKYRRSVIGGCIDAELEITGENSWQLLNKLRSPIEIYWKGVLVWWGFINSVKIGFPSYTLGVSLDGMYNRIKLVYSRIVNGEEIGERAETDWIENSDLGKLYGRRELLVSSSGMNDSQAASALSTILTQLGKVRATIEFGSNQGIGTLFAKGWWLTLDWQYYSNSATNVVDTTSIISTIINNAAQFYRGVQIVQTSGISGSNYRSGDTTALIEITQLLEQGTSTGLRLLADTTPSRILKVYPEREKFPYFVELVFGKNGEIRNTTGHKIDPEMCPVGLGMLEDPLLSNIDSRKVVGMDIFYVDSGEYAVGRGYTPVIQGSISPWDVIQRITQG